MKEFIEIKGGEHVLLSDVKRMRSISDKDRESLSQLGEHVDASRFNTRIDHANNATSYAPETVDQIAAQGVSLVQVDKDAFIPRDNISRSRDLTARDRLEFEEKTGRPLRDDFKSQIETKAGRVLATVDSRTVMQRMGQVYQPNSAAPAVNREEAMQNTDLQKTRDALKKSTSPQSQVTASQSDQTRTSPQEPTQ